MMKNWLSYILIMALLTMNISFLHHVDECHETGSGEVLQLASHLDGSHSHAHAHAHESQPTEQEVAECEDCVDSHHHHSYASILDSKADTLITAGTVPYRWNGETYLSHLGAPPSKPPKA